MKKYSFRLEQVRRVRQTQEEVAKAALLEANKAVMEAQQLVVRRQSDFERMNSMPSSLTSQAVFAKNRYFSELAQRSVIAAREAEAAARAVAEDKRLHWSKAAMAVKVLDRLDERKREEFAIDYNRELDKELDDVVTTRFGVQS